MTAINVTQSLNKLNGVFCWEIYPNHYDDLINILISDVKCNYQISVYIPVRVQTRLYTHGYVEMNI